jgi:hypothetical protein
VPQDSASYLDGAMAVSVGFDDGQEVNVRAKPTLELTNVVGDSGQIDFRPGERLVLTYGRPSFMRAWVLW